MSDPETRLRTDAQRPMDVPDFDDAVDVARSVASPSIVRRQHGPRRPVGNWLAAAAAVVAVAGGATALSAARGDDGHRAIAPATQHHHPAVPSTVPSTLPSAVSFTPKVVGITVDSKNTSSGGPLYMVFVTAPRATVGKDCADTPSMHVIETATQVRIRVAVLHRASGQFRCETQGLPDPRNGALLAGFVDGLKHPLGNRAVVDDGTGKPVEVFTPTYPRATYLPTGYAEKLQNVDDPMTRTFGDPRPGFLAPMSVVQGFSPRHGSAADDITRAPLVVVQAPYDTVNRGAHVVDHVVVNGHDATVTDTSKARCVTWTRDGHSAIQVCSQAKQLLGANELVRVARGLR